MRAACLTRIKEKKIISLCEIQEAVRLVLPAELAKHATTEGTKAVARAAKANTEASVDLPGDVPHPGPNLPGPHPVLGTLN